MMKYLIRWKRWDAKRGQMFGYRHRGPRDDGKKTGPIEFDFPEDAERECALLNEHTTVYTYSVEQRP